MKTERTFEFDSFGPWIYLIDEVHTIPPLFASAEQAVSGSIMKFKIPRNVERRNAHPKMNLYDTVVAIFATEIILLERVTKERQETVKQTRIPIQSICALHNRTCLLSGELFIITLDRKICIPYNTVSTTIIHGAIHLIRSLLTNDQLSKSLLLNLPTLPFSYNTMELNFLNLCQQYTKEDPGLRLIGHQPNLQLHVLREFKSPLLMKLGLKTKVNSGYVVFLSQEEIIITQRTFAPDKSGTDCYSYVQNIIPLDSVIIEPAISKAPPYEAFYLKTHKVTELFYYDPNEAGMNAIIQFIKYPQNADNPVLK